MIYSQHEIFAAAQHAIDCVDVSETNTPDITARNIVAVCVDKYNTDNGLTYEADAVEYDVEDTERLFDDLLITEATRGCVATIIQQHFWEQLAITAIYEDEDLRHPVYV